MVVDGVRPTPGDAVENEDCGDDIWIGRGNAKESPRGSQWISSPAFPVAERLAADADHGCELPARLMEFAANFAHINGLELAAVACARPQVRPSAAKLALEDEWIEHRIRAVVGPASRLMKCVSLGLGASSPCGHAIAIRKSDARPRVCGRYEALSQRRWVSSERGPPLGTSRK